MRFIDNALIDIPGPDLYVFEIGPEVESTLLEVSENGKDWIDAGPIQGSTAEIDLSDRIQNEGQVYQYVRLTDRNIRCKPGKYSGADIDAVGAIGSVIRISLSGEVLFDFDSDKLRDEGVPEIKRVVDVISKYPGAQILVEGHTDSKGSDEYNETLSRKRAVEVTAFLAVLGNIPVERIERKGYGESRPVATNDTDAGRQKNRRVEIIIKPVN